jgi:hypothetical protein
MTIPVKLSIANITLEQNKIVLFYVSATVRFLLKLPRDRLGYPRTFNAPNSMAGYVVGITTPVRDHLACQVVHLYRLGIY